VPVPQPNPLKVTVEATETNAQPAQQEGKPFWKFW
jgi:hypothetical protein